MKINFFEVCVDICQWENVFLQLSVEKSIILLFFFIFVFEDNNDKYKHKRLDMKNFFSDMQCWCIWWKMDDGKDENFPPYFQPNAKQINVEIYILWTKQKPRRHFITHWIKFVTKFLNLLPWIEESCSYKKKKILNHNKSPIWTFSIVNFECVEHFSSKSKLFL
jgi:hypothetical protein